MLWTLTAPTLPIAAAIPYSCPRAAVGPIALEANRPRLLPGPTSPNARTNVSATTCGGLGETHTDRT